MADFLWIFMEKYRIEKERLRRLRGRFGAGSGGWGLLMAGLVLVAAVVCGQNGGAREAASKQANHTDSRLVIIDAGHGGDDPGKSEWTACRRRI